MAMVGRMAGIASRKTRLLAGRASGARKTGDSATARSDGTVRPVRAMKTCPSAELAYSMKAQAAGLLRLAAVRK